MNTTEAVLALRDATCEVCGAKAVAAVADTRAAELVEGRDEDGQLVSWYRYEVVGRHYFCRAHDRDPIRYPLR